MGNVCEGLLQDQALVRVRAIGTSTENLMRQLLVVGGRIEPAQAQAKSILAAWSSVAGAHIAATDIHRRDDLATKADSLAACTPFDNDRHVDGARARGDFQTCPSIPFRANVPT